MAPCELCNNLEKRPLDHVRLALDFTYEELLLSVRSPQRTTTCAPCCLILEAIERTVSTPEADIRRIYIYGLATEFDTLTLQLYFVDDRPKLILEIFHPEVQVSGPSRGFWPAIPERILKMFHLDIDSGSSRGRWPAIRARPLTKGHPLGRESLSWVTGLLESCQGNHASDLSAKSGATSCGSRTPSALPRRVLRLEQRPDSSISVHLQENHKEIPMKALYATLSHCWGSHHTCITTTANINRHSRGIAWTEVPLTWRQIIQYCLKLDISYLWIDALCIIQDDAEDWQEESAKMADIYQNSFLTLAATASSSDATGCFTEHNEDMDTGAFALKSGPRGLPVIMVRRAHKHWTLPPTPASQQDYPLLARGWVFQEILLSPRVIHFGRHELIWECACQIQCECGGSTTGLKGNAFLWANSSESAEITEATIDTKGEAFGFETECALEPSGGRVIAGESEADEELEAAGPGGSEVADMLERHTVKTAVKEEIKERHSRAWDQWRGITQEYSALHLTKPSDRLPALSGLAKRSASMLGPYYAGLWKSTLPGDLLWRVEKLEPHSAALQGLATYRAPSWSWACVESPVLYWDFREVDLPTEATMRMLRYADRGRGAGAPSASWARMVRVLGCETHVAGKNPFGEVQSGSLRLKGDAKAATVSYTSHPIGNFGDEVRFEHDPLRYELHMYNAGTGRTELPFFADYILSAAGPNYIEDNSNVLILSISRWRNISLVLKQTGERYQRIGIFRAPPAYFDIYKVDFMRGSEEKEVTII